MNKLFLCRLAVSLIVFATVPYDALAQASRVYSQDRERGHAMLRSARDEVKKNYYDPTFRGLDLNAEFKQYDSLIDKAQNLGEMFRAVAAFLNAFHDSHLFFEPPPRAVNYFPDYRMEMVGDKCFITHVRPKSDAADKLTRGDQVFTLNGFHVGREEFPGMQYYFRLLAPQPDDVFQIGTPHGTMSTTVHARVKKGKTTLDMTDGDNSPDLWDELIRGEEQENLFRERTVETEGALIWKMAQFGFSRDLLDGIMATARKHPALIIDLRGNPGGYVDSLELLVGSLFDHDVKIADRVMRKPGKSQLAKHVSKPYTGKIIVLVDSESASSAELFARVMQLEHRGTVIGDRSAGAVMESMSYTETQGTDTIIFYGFSVTHANLLMADGTSLEGKGVVPDEIVLPAQADITAGRDPALSRAAEIANVKLSPEAAGSLFPYEWGPI